LFSRLGKPHGPVYVRLMDATRTSLKDRLPAAAAGTTGAGMSFTIRAAMSQTVVPDLEHSG
jgi:hypothetical protein